jgi:hypothetical protein
MDLGRLGWPGATEAVQRKLAVTTDSQVRTVLAEVLSAQTLPSLLRWFARKTLWVDLVMDLGKAQDSTLHRVFQERPLRTLHLLLVEASKMPESRSRDEVGLARIAAGLGILMVNTPLRIAMHKGVCRAQD